MKKIIICVLLMIGIAGISYAAGPPVQPVPDVKGCWVMDYVMAQISGSSTNPTAPGSPPYYYQPARKNIASIYVDITSQSGTKLYGTYYTWNQNAFRESTLEGTISGSSFSFFTAGNSFLGGDSEELRYLTGILTTDSQSRVIQGFGIVSRDNDPSINYSWAQFTFNFKMRPYSGSCPGPDPLPVQDYQKSGPPACPWDGCLCAPNKFYNPATNQCLFY